MQSLRQLIALLILLAMMGALLQAGDKKKTRFFLKPDQTADLSSPMLGTARQNCENWALAAGLESLLARQDVPLDQKFWIMRLYYGELCIDRLPSIEQLAQVV